MLCPPRALDTCSRLTRCYVDPRRVQWAPVAISDLGLRAFKWAGGRMEAPGVWWTDWTSCGRVHRAPRRPKLGRLKKGTPGASGMLPTGDPTEPPGDTASGIALPSERDLGSWLEYWSGAGRHIFPVWKGDKEAGRAPCGEKPGPLQRLDVHRVPVVARKLLDTVCHLKSVCFFFFHYR